MIFARWITVLTAINVPHLERHSRIWHSQDRASWLYSYTKIQQDALFLNFILVKNSTCFGQTYCPSSGVINTLFSATVISHTEILKMSKWPIDQYHTINTTKPVPSLPHQQTFNINRYVQQCYCIGRTYCIFWNIFAILSFLYNMEFYLQHVLQFNYNVNVYTLVILPLFNISVWRILIAVNTVLRLIMMDSKSVRNM